MTEQVGHRTEGTSWPCPCQGRHTFLPVRAWCEHCEEYCYIEQHCMLGRLTRRLEDAEALLRQMRSPVDVPSHEQDPVDG